MLRLQMISFFSTGNSGSTGAVRNSSCSSAWLKCDKVYLLRIVLRFSTVDCQLPSGGVTPWKKIHEIKRPTQTTKPKMLTT